MIPTRSFCVTSGRLTQSIAFARSFLSCERFRFVSRIFRFKRGGRGEFRRRIFDSAACFASRTSAARCSIVMSNRSRANRRLRICERESCTVTLRPVGRWRRVTAVATLFTFCPPGPDERANVSSSSFSGRLFTICPAFALSSILSMSVGVVAVSGRPETTHNKAVTKLILPGDCLSQESVRSSTLSLALTGRKI